jgi:putative peptide zinc metalloprotease protein
MATADAFRSSTTRPVGLRRRGDLVTNRQLHQGQAWWVVKDPISLSYFRFRPEEYALLDMLDGDVSLEQLKDQFEARFPPRRITLDELARFVATLHRSGLVMGDRPGQGPQLYERRKQRIWKQWMAWLANIMSLRFRGIDPDWMLTKLDPWFGWLFEPWAIAVAMSFVTSAVMLVLVNFDVFRSKLPDFHQFFASGNWLYLAVALGITKILHEFGHGLSCKHYGGECHEMGMMLLVFTPCLYCDVSDSWMLPSKWKRAAIGAAGMYVEVIIASIATYLWWNSHAGIFNQLCLDVMFVSSVSTILFNANPLMRYDGYYILSDILEIPNLRQKASSILSRTATQWCLGIKQPEDPFLPQRKRGLFALYAVASSLYMWMVSASIFLFMWSVFKPYRLEVLGQILAAGALWGLVIRPLQSMIKFLNVPGRRDEVKALNVTVSGIVAAVVLAAIALIPLPQRVWCAAELRPRGEEMVYVTVAGRLESLAVKAGDVVKKGRSWPDCRASISILRSQIWRGRPRSRGPGSTASSGSGLPIRRRASRSARWRSRSRASRSNWRRSERTGRSSCSWRRGTASCCRRRMCHRRRRRRPRESCRAGRAMRSTRRTSGPPSPRARCSAWWGRRRSSRV